MMDIRVVRKIAQIVLTILIICFLVWLGAACVVMIGKGNDAYILDKEQNKGGVQVDPQLNINKRDTVR